MKPIYITGAGIISAVGCGVMENIESLKKGETGIGPMHYLRSRHTDIPVGEVKQTNDELAERLNITLPTTFGRGALLGMVALKEALESASILPGQIPKRTHFVSATTVGGMDRRELNYSNEKKCGKWGAEIATYNCGDFTSDIAERFGTFSSVQTVSTACSAATNAIITGANMINCAIADIVVAGGVESLSMFHLNGFNTLMILDREQCKPFDANRAGLNLGEGAAYLILESAESVRKRGVTPIAILSGWGNACDAHHQTASSPNGEGAYRAMKEALEAAGLQPCDIDYINAHGTGTPNNDQSESEAVKRLFGENIPPLSSTKSFTGHTTSASGSIEAVLSIYAALKEQFLPVNLNWNTPMEEGIIPVTSSKSKREIAHIMTNAFGFGGNDSCLILSRSNL